MKNTKLKVLIELAANVDEADSYIEQYTDYTTFKEKKALIDGMFGYYVIFREDSDSDTEAKEDYYALLTTIVNKKYKN